MPYKSKLAAVLFQRKRREDEAERVFLTAKNQLVSEEEHLSLLNVKLQATLDDLTTKQAEGATAEEISRYLRFIEMFQETVNKQAKALLRQEEVCEASRAQLVIAVKERKAVETIEEKREKTYSKEVTKKEQAILDEIGGQLRLRPHG